MSWKLQNSIEVAASKTPSPSPDTSSTWDLFGNTDAVPSVPKYTNPKAALGNGDSMAESVGGDALNSVTGIQTLANQIYYIAIGVMIVYLLICFVIAASQLSQYADNPQKRQQVLTDLKRNAIAIAILGGVSTIIKLAISLGLS